MMEVSRHDSRRGIHSFRILAVVPGARGCCRSSPTHYFKGSRLISVNNVTMRYGARILFEDVTTTFQSGRRYAISGPNGAGKSTLMKILTSEIEPSKGSVTRPKRMGVLAQDQFAFDAFGVLDTVIMGNGPLWEALQEREKLYDKDPST